MQEAAPLSARDPRLIRIGRILDFLGQVIFPLMLGTLAGFYAADQGVPLVPSMMRFTLSASIFALLLIAAGRWMRGKAFVETDQGARLRKRVVLALVLATLALGLRLAVHATERPSELTVMVPLEFEAAFEMDTTRYQEHDAGMEHLLARLEDNGSLGEEVLSAAEEVMLLDAWESLYSYAFALDQIRVFYEDYWRFDPSRVERSYHLRSFLLTFAAELSLYEKATRFSTLVLENPNATKFLDVPRPERGLPASSFSRFRQELLGSRDQARVIAGSQYLEFLEAAVGGRSEAMGLGVGWLWRDVEAHLQTIHATGALKQASLTVRADTQLLKREVRRIWYPIQAEAAEVLGDTRVRRIGWYLITEAQQQEMDPHLEPGDILMSRKNWYLSNVGLPGFWPHALIYLGDPDKLIAAMADDPEVSAWLREETGMPVTFMQYLQMIAPTPTLLYQLGHGEESYRVIEAISEGVVLNTMSHAAGDYLVALRPRLSNLAKAQAIAYAFTQADKPYDFDFDFATDHALVCTELVWRAYRPAAGKAGLNIPLIEVAGRKTLPANTLAEFYAQQADDPDRQLDFVYFLDAVEGERKAVVSDEAAFRASADRVKWDVAQK
ncbi:MAG: YiiX/YebB-like N1pC/P60 family cysteine hydrolase [Myxococcota bacterium]|nr:YiiX/YebB-like N1pC/P60 family cysteine hydrolase [Myxococcota bacterium]